MFNNIKQLIKYILSIVLIINLSLGEENVVDLQTQKTTFYEMVKAVPLMIGSGLLDENSLNQLTTHSLQLAAKFRRDGDESSRTDMIGLSSSIPVILGNATSAATRLRHCLKEKNLPNTDNIVKGFLTGLLGDLDDCNLYDSNSRGC